MLFEPRRELDWQVAGLCYGQNPKHWETQNLNPLWPEKEAAQLCRGCPVINECFLDAQYPRPCSDYAGYPGELDAELETVGVVRAGRVW